MRILPTQTVHHRRGAEDAEKILNRKARAVSGHQQHGTNGDLSLTAIPVVSPVMTGASLRSPRLRGAIFGLALVGIALGLTACVGGRSPESRFFQLQPGQPATDAPALDPSIFIAVTTVNLESYLRKPQMADRIQPHEVRYREFRRWAEPLDRNITRVITENLRHLLKTDLVAAVPQTQADQKVISLLVEIKRFERQPDGRVLLSAGWLALPGKPPHPGAKVGTAELYSDVVREDAAAIAAIQSDLLQELSVRIAADLRAAAGTP